MALPNTFENQTSPDMIELDQNFSAIAVLTPIPCSVAGVNALTLTPLSNTPTVSAYQNYMQFTGIAAGTNTGAVTAQVGALASLQVYKDTAGGSVPLSGNEITAGTAIVVMYDSALAGGAGGFHLVNYQARSIREKATISTITFGAIVPNGSSTATVTVPGCSVGDIVDVGYPSYPSVGLVFTPSVPNAGTVIISVFNAFWTLATITPPAGRYVVATKGYLL